MMRIKKRLKTSVAANLLAALFLSKKNNRNLLYKLFLNQVRPISAAKSIYIHCPARFLRYSRLRGCHGALRTFLEFCLITQSEAQSLGVSCKIIICDDFADIHDGSLVFSHHTHRSEVERLRSLDSIVLRHVKAGDLPGTWIIDSQGYSGWSSMTTLPISAVTDCASDSVAEGFILKHKDYIYNNNISKYQQNGIMESPGVSGDYVFVALQVIDDSVQQLAYVPMLEMLQMVANRFNGTKYSVLIKRHPKCTSQAVSDSINSILIRHPNCHLTTASVHAILPNCAAVFTVNSGVGSEAILYKKPLYIFGDADYSIAAHQIASFDDLVDLTTPIRPKLKTEIIAKFYFYYRMIYQCGNGISIRDRVRIEIRDWLRPGGEGLRRPE